MSANRLEKSACVSKKPMLFDSKVGCISYATRNFNTADKNRSSLTSELTLGSHECAEIRLKCADDMEAKQQCRK